MMQLVEEKQNTCLSNCFCFLHLQWVTPVVNLDPHAGDTVPASTFREHKWKKAKINEGRPDRQRENERLWSMSLVYISAQLLTGVSRDQVSCNQTCKQSKCPTWIVEIGGSGNLNSKKKRLKTVRKRLRAEQQRLQLQSLVLLRRNVSESRRMLSFFFVFF